MITKPKIPHLGVFSLLFFLTFSLKAQQETWTWWLGTQVALKFNTAAGPPVKLETFPLTSWNGEGCASFADASGNLIFIVEGSNAYDKNFNLLPNGSGLMGSVSSAQGVLAVKQPGNDSKYYLFTTPPVSGTDGAKSPADGFRYSIFDADLVGNGTVPSPLGDIEAATKNTLLFTPSTERVAATDGSECNTVWIVAHESGSSNLYAYKLDETGLSAPVISAVSPITGNERGVLVFSPDGSKLAMSTWDNQVVIYNFNNTTGVISAPVEQFNPTFTWGGTYGLAFSASGRYLYVTSLGEGEIQQYDLLAASVFGSRYIVEARDGWFSAKTSGLLKLGPDDKIYIARQMDQAVSVINSPDLAGAACDFDKFAFTTTLNIAYGMPQMFISASDPPTIDAVVKNDVSCSALGDITITASGGTGALEYSIDNGATYQASNSFTGLSAATYNIVVRDAALCADNTTSTITGALGPSITSTTDVDPTCGNSNVREPFDHKHH